MDITQFQIEAQRTINRNLTHEQLLHNMTLGILGELGEVSDLYKKHFYQGHELNLNKLRIEVGDLFWYMGNLATIIGITIQPTPRKQIGATYWHMTTQEGLIIQSHEHAQTIAQRIAITTSVIPAKRRMPAIQNSLNALAGRMEYLLNIEGQTLYDALDDVIDKLKKRYPDAFSPEASITRRDEQTLAA